MHSPVPVALLHTPHVEQMAMAFQAAVLEPLVRRGVIRLTARQAVFSRDHLLLEQIEHAQLFIVFLSQGVDQAQLRGLPLLESLRLRHGRSALVLPVLAQATFESLAEGFLPLPMNMPPDDVQALSRLAPAVEQALTDVRSLKTNHGEYPPPKPIMGREHVLEDMHRFFAGGAARFICLTAPFGRGASSIARAYAESIEHEFPGGCIDMSSLDDDEASRRLAQTLGIHTLPSNLQSPAVLLNELLAARTDTLVLLDMSFRQYAKVPAPIFGARTIITTHVEMNVPTAYTYQVPKLDELGRTRLARHMGLEGPLQDVPEGEPLAYYLLRGIRSLERDDEKIAHALKQAKELNRKADLHESWLTPIAAFFAVWWSLLPEETRRVVGTLSLCPPSGIFPQERAERFADMENSFAAALEPLRVTELITQTNAGLLAVQPALLAWLERFQPEIRIAACQRAEKAQERVFLDLERLELEHTKRGTDGLIEEMTTLRQAGFFGANENLAKTRNAVERGRGLFKVPQAGDRPEAFLQHLLNQAVRYDNPTMRDDVAKLLHGRECTFLEDRFAAGSPNLGRLLRDRDKRATTYSMRQGHTGPIVALAHSTRCVISASEDGLLLCWDVATGACLGAMDVLPRQLTAMAADANGRFAVVGAYDGSIHVWNLESLSRQTRAQQSEPVSAIAMNPEGTLCASAGPSGALFLWNAVTSEPIAKSWAHQGRVTGLAWLDASRLASLGADGIVRVWNSENMECLHARYLRGPGLAFAVAQSTGLVTLDASGHLLRFSGDTIEEIGAIQVGPKARSCAVTNDGTFVISGHEDGVVRVWLAESGRLVAERVDRFPVQAMVAVGSTSFAHSEMNVFRVVDVRTPADVMRVPAAAASALPTSSAIAEVILPDLPWPVVDDAISTQHEHCQYTFSCAIPREEIARDWAVRAMTDAPSGELILLGNDGTISVLNLETKSVVRRSKPPFADPFWPALSVDGTIALSVAPRQKPPEYTDSEGPAAKRAAAVEVPGRKSMILWNTLSNEVLGTLPREVEPSMLFTKTAAGHVFLATREGMELWDLPSGKLVNHRRGERVAISKSGRWAAVRTEDGILIEEVDSGRPLRLVRGISGMRGKCLLRSDGRAFVTTESSTDLCFVDTENATVFRSPQLNWNTEIRAVGFSADESLVFVAMKDGTIDIRETFTGLLRGQAACPERLPIRYLVTTPRLVVCDDRVGLHLFEPRAQRV